MRLPDTLKAIATSAKTGSTATADIGGTNVTVEVARDVSVSSGDALILSRSNGTFYVVGRAGIAAPAALPDSPPPVPPPKQTQRGQLVISPVETRSYRNGAWRLDTDEIVQGAYGALGNSTGVAFYGDKPRSLEGAIITGVQLQVRRADRGGGNASTDTTAWLVTESARPAGAPTLSASTAGPSIRRGYTASVALPASMGQALVDGTAGGIAVYAASGTPFVVFAGQGEWSPSFTVILSWER